MKQGRPAEEGKAWREGGVSGGSCVISGGFGARCGVRCRCGPCSTHSSSFCLSDSSDIVVGRGEPAAKDQAVAGRGRGEWEEAELL